MKRKLEKMELRLHHIIDPLYNVFHENGGKENCAQLLEEEPINNDASSGSNDASTSTSIKCLAQNI